MALYSNYFEQQLKYAAIYGAKTIVFMEVGKFYEAYNTKKKGYALEKLEQLLGVKYIRRSGEDICKPNQLGFPTISLTRHLTTLIDNGYTIVVFDQVNNGKKIERQVAGIYSPSTYLPDKEVSDINYLLSIYIVEERQLKSNNLLAVGVTIIDVSTGSNMIHEVYSNRDDENFGLDEIVRMFNIFRPKETVIYYNTLDNDKEVIKNVQAYLELDKYPHHFYTYHKKRGSDKLDLLSEEMFKINYQNDYLAKIYNLNKQLELNKKTSSIEILDLEKKQYAIISLIIILKYISEHNVLLLTNLTFPIIYIYNQHLILGNNAIEQLNIIDANNLDSYNHKIESLFDVVNKTSTPMGRRYLKSNLLNPLSQEYRERILQRYDMIAELRREGLYTSIRLELRNIYDVEKLHRRMALGVILPNQFYRLDLYYQATIKIITLIQDNEVLRDVIAKKVVKRFMNYQLQYNEHFDFEKLQLCSNYNEIEDSFFKEGVNEAIDKAQDKIKMGKTILDAMKCYFIRLIVDKCKRSEKDLVSIESNDMDGYYFSISKAREKKLHEVLDNEPDVIHIDIDVGQTLVIQKRHIVFRKLKKGNTKIFVTSLKNHVNKLAKRQLKFCELVKKMFIETMTGYYVNHKRTLHEVCKFIAEIDFLVSGAIVAEEYYYCRPVITSTESIPSYLQATQLRHAIIERLCHETEYIPHTIELGNVDAKNGILLYG